jgi:hypothetical protein
MLFDGVIIRGGYHFRESICVGLTVRVVRQQTRRRLLCYVLARMWHAWAGREMDSGIWWGKLKGRKLWKT